MVGTAVGQRSRPPFLGWRGVLCFLLALALSAESPRLRFRTLSPRDGLPQSIVTALLRDRDGFLWIGTRNGLCRYDGYQLVIHAARPEDPRTLSEDSITCLYEDRKGTLWVGTETGGVGCKRRGVPGFEVFRNDPARLDSLAHNTVTGIAEDAQGNLWFATAAGLDAFQPDTRTFHHVDTGRFQATWVCTDEQARVWVGLLGHGLARFDPKTGQITRLEVEEPTAHGAVLVQGEGLWFVTERNLWLLDPETGGIRRRLRLPGVPRGIAADSSGHLWIAMHSLGLLCVDRATGDMVAHRATVQGTEGLVSDHLNRLLVDPQGMLWVGTAVAGLSYANLQPPPFRALRPPRSRDPVYSIRAIHRLKDGQLLVGGYHGLDRYDPSTDLWTRLPLPRMDPPLYIYALQPADPDESQFWVGTEGGGLYGLDMRTGRFTALSLPGFQGSQVWGFHLSRDGTLWIGTNEGVHRHGPGAKEDRFYPYAAFPGASVAPGALGGVRVIREDAAGRIWLGVRPLGLLSLDPQTGHFASHAYVPHRDSQSATGSVMGMTLDRKGQLWLGTNSGGLVRFDPVTGMAETFTTQDGLPNNVVYAIQEDAKGRLWLSTNRGLSRFSPDHRVFRNFDESDGLSGMEFNGGAHFRNAATGEILFGGVDGLTAILPDAVRDHPSPPAVFITDIKLFNRSIKPGPDAPLQVPIEEAEEVVLKPGHSVITLSFAAVHFSAPERNLCSYRLDGFDRDWTLADAQHRYVTYTNLSPGTYVFRLKACNGDGVWTRADRTLRIVVVPPLWRTLWFRILASGALMGIVGLLVAWRLLLLRRRNRMLERLVGIRTREIQEVSDRLYQLNEEKNRVIGVAAHDLRNPLSGILLTGELLREDAPEALLPDVENILRTGRRMQEIIQGLLDLHAIERNVAEVPTLEGVLPAALLQEVRIAHASKAQSKDLVIHVEAAPGVEVLADPRHLVRVLDNLLSNAVKYSPRGRNIWVRFGPEGGGGRFEVQDEGPGLTPEDHQRVFGTYARLSATPTGGEPSVGLGLSIVKKLVESMGGRIGVESEPGKGATFWFWLPQASP